MSCEFEYLNKLLILLNVNKNKAKSGAGRSAKRNPPLSSGKRQAKQTSKSTVPLASGSSSRSGVARQRLSPDGKSLRVKHREYARSLTGGAANTMHGFQAMISPTNQLLFPWLAGIAANYESYLFHKLRFHYVPSCSATDQGTAIMAVDYDPTDDNEVDIGTLFSMFGSIYSNVWKEFSHVSTIKDLRKRKTYYTTPRLDGSEKRDNPVGRLYAYVEGMANDRQAGRIFVDYDIELMTQQARDPSSESLFFRTTGQSTNILDPTNTWTWGYGSYAKRNNTSIALRKFEGLMFHFEQSPSSHTSDLPQSGLVFTQFKYVRTLVLNAVWYGVNEGAPQNMIFSLFAIKTEKDGHEDSSIQITPSTASGTRSVDPRIIFIPTSAAECMTFFPVSEHSAWVVQPPLGELPVNETKNIATIFN